MEDKKLYIKINILAIVIVILSMMTIPLILSLLFGKTALSFSGSDFMMILVIFAIFIIIHEFIHGFFFKVFSKSGKVKYGFSKGMFYAANPGVIYTKKQFIMIAIAPFIINSLLFILLLGLGMHSNLILGVFILHTSACAGDFWYVYELIKQPAITHCEDTLVGIKLFISKDKSSS